MSTDNSNTTTTTKTRKQKANRVDKLEAALLRQEELLQRLLLDKPQQRSILGVAVQQQQPQQQPQQPQQQQPQTAVIAQAALPQQPQQQQPQQQPQQQQPQQISVDYRDIPSDKTVKPDTACNSPKPADECKPGDDPFNRMTRTVYLAKETKKKLIGKLPDEIGVALTVDILDTATGQITQKCISKSVPLKLSKSNWQTDIDADCNIRYDASGSPLWSFDVPGCPGLTVVLGIPGFYGDVKGTHNTASPYVVDETPANTKRKGKRNLKTDNPWA